MTPFNAEDKRVQGIYRPNRNSDFVNRFLSLKHAKHPTVARMATTTRVIILHSE
jgi:hypothetical protein